MFTKILIANRGEIACRVAATARRLGVQTVAVYSQADARARHVTLCDEAVPIGPAPARASYLRGERIIEVARASGAQAIHPGYGFLSENADFAQACIDAGLVFIGPPPAAIRAMGSKSAAKTLMNAAQVPLVPGYHGTAQDVATLAAEADRIGYPVLIKASSGGGGKGMRIVRHAAEFNAALASCQREALASFGDAAVLLEKYLLRPRHIEIQVFADAHGQCVSLFERDCSVQRRHQKVVEEAPAPGMDKARRTAMGEAAVKAAQAVGYVGAGTVEFIVDTDGTYAFMEMNTRLQVEHPVTEMVTGFDLVQWQLRVACGEPLPVNVAALAQRQPRGHAIEVRLYAENPDQGFLPAVGTLQHLALPSHVDFACPTGHAELLEPPCAVRVDGGVRVGDTITPHYDPMIAKLIVWGADRAQALARMRAALAQVRIVGVAHNVDFLTRLMHTESFAHAELDTGLIEREHAALFAPLPAPCMAVMALACARVLADESAPLALGAWSDPWDRRCGWRLKGHNSPATRTLRFRVGDEVVELVLEYASEAYVIRYQGQTAFMTFEAHEDGALTLHWTEGHLSAHVLREANVLHVFRAGRHRTLTLLDAAAPLDTAPVQTGALTAPMPGKVVALLVAPGVAVRQGETLLLMEAMKMEHAVTAPTEGQVSEFLYAVGDAVKEGAVLLKFSAA